MMPDLLALFDAHGIAGFVIGAVVAWAYIFIKARCKGKMAKFPRVSLIWIMAAATVLTMGYSLNETRNNRVRAESLTACQLQFQATMADLIAIGKEDRALTERKETADGKWLTSVLSPPPVIAAMAINDPRRREYGIKVSQEWSSELAAVQHGREANEIERSQKKLPPIDCGKK